MIEEEEEEEEKELRGEGEEEKKKKRRRRRRRFFKRCIFDALLFNPVCAKVPDHKSARHDRVTHSFSSSKKYVTTKAQHLNTCNDEAKQMRVLSSPVVYSMARSKFVW